MSNLTNVSPIDGRYQSQILELSRFFSESALIRYRIQIEIQYLIALSKEKKIKELKLNRRDIKRLDNLWQKFGLKEARRVKQIEKITDHDVKAIEYYIKFKIQNSKFKIIKNTRTFKFIHFALTSEDINNLVVTLQFKDGLTKVYLPVLNQLLNNLKRLARANKNLTLLALTHGQPATPTTLGKELAVFCFRLKNQINNFKKIKFFGKLNGASGCFAAHKVAYPEVDWIGFSKKFIGGLGLKFNPLTTQIESHDNLIEAYDILRHINNILIDFDRDVWFYVSRGVFSQKLKRSEVGSSTMPHKINPINFENSEGNLAVANALLNFFSNKLPISRMQRDLSDSAVLRNQGVALAHSFLGVKSILKGLKKLEVDKKTIRQELDNNQEVLAEAIQTILRKVGYPKPYERLKKLTRGQKLDKEKIRKFIERLNIDNEEKRKLLKLSVSDYNGLAGKLVDGFL